MAVVFDLLAEDGVLPVNKFIKRLQTMGIKDTDMRFRETIKNFRMQAMSDDLSNLVIDKDTFAK